KSDGKSRTASNAACIQLLLLPATWARAASRAAIAKADSGSSPVMRLSFVNKTFERSTPRTFVDLAPSHKQPAFGTTGARPLDHPILRLGAIAIARDLRTGHS